MSVSMSMGRSTTTVASSLLRRSINHLFPTIKSSSSCPVLSWFQQNINQSATGAQLIVANNEVAPVRNQLLYNMDADISIATKKIGGIGEAAPGMGLLDDMATWLISTLKRRKKKMNKHKLKKRRKRERLKANK